MQVSAVGAVLFALVFIAPCAARAAQNLSVRQTVSTSRRPKVEAIVMTRRGGLRTLTIALVRVWRQPTVMHVVPYSGCRRISVT
jgi:hypothetical protein